VAIHKTNHTLFVINNPDVYKNPTSDTYIVFGKIQIQDINLHTNVNAVENIMSTYSVQDLDKNMPKPVIIAPRQKKDKKKEDIDYKGLNKNDVELVSAEAKVTKHRAIEALLLSGNDIINAVISLTK